MAPLGKGETVLGPTNMVAEWGTVEEDAVLGTGVRYMRGPEEKDDCKPENVWICCGPLQKGDIGRGKAERTMWPNVQRQTDSIQNPS